MLLLVSAQAAWLCGPVVALAPANLTRGMHISFDLRILSFAIGVSVLTGILFGIAPALAASRGQLAEGLRESGRSNVGGMNRLRALLVGGEQPVRLVERDRIESGERQVEQAGLDHGMCLARQAAPQGMSSCSTTGTASRRKCSAHRGLVTHAPACTRWERCFTKWSLACMSVLE